MKQNKILSFLFLGAFLSLGILLSTGEAKAATSTSVTSDIATSTSKLPDFSISDIKATRNGTSTIIEVAVINKGKTASSTHDLGINLQGSVNVFGILDKDVFPAGTKVVRKFFVDFSTSSKLYIKATVDMGNHFVESNKNNNSLTKTITLPKPALPDLAVADITLKDASSSPLSKMVLVKIINSGTASYSYDAMPTPSLVRLDIKSLGIFMEREIIGGLGKGKTKVISFPVQVSASTTKLSASVLVDSNNVVVESKEENNYKERRNISVTVKLPDLFISNITISKASTTEGIGVKARVFVNNKGALASSKKTGGVIYIKEDSWAEERAVDFVIDQIKSGNGQILSVDLGIISRKTTKVYLKTVVDSGNLIMEKNESNNEFKKEYQLSDGKVLGYKIIK